MLKWAGIITGMAAVVGTVGLIAGVVPKNIFFSGTSNTLKDTTAQKIKIENAKEKFELAQALLSDSSEDDQEKIGITMAFDFLLEAAKLGHARALGTLERMGGEMSAEKKMGLSALYRSFNDNKKADYWLAKAQQVEGFKFRI